MKSAHEMAAEQAAFWNGPGGENWLAGSAWRERSWTPLSRVLMEAADARVGERIIDVGCGNGTTTVELAKAVGVGGQVLGIDLSEALIAAARSHSIDNTEFMVGDAATRHFRQEAYDMIFSRFGVMFFGDPVLAFRNLYQALKPGGRLVFICWRAAQENPWSFVLGRAVAPFLPPLRFSPPGPEEPGLYSFGDRPRLERILTESGFKRHAVQPVDRLQWMAATNDEILSFMTQGGPHARAFADADPVTAEKAKAAVHVALKPYQTAEGVYFPAACWLVHAHKS